MSKKIIGFLLALTICLPLMCSCAKNIMSIDEGEDKLSINEMQFFMSRMKGVLAGYGYDVDSTAFWGSIISMDGTTYDEYYKARVMKDASMYMTARYLFEKEGLELSKDEKRGVKDTIDSLIELVGSKNQLNSTLSSYGVNVNILENIYLTELKMQKLKEHYFGTDGSKVENSEARKQEFLEQNYVAFKQVFLAGYEYECITDTYGNKVYYTDTSYGKISYDEVNGQTRTDVYTGELERDENGDIKYFDESGKILYDKSGVTKYKLDENGEKIIVKYTSEQIANIKSDAEALAQGKKTVEEFEEMIKIYSQDESVSEKRYLRVEDGYYGSISDVSAYFDTMAKKLYESKDGECIVVQSGAGIHIAYRYDCDTGAYDDEAYKDTFTAFNEEFVNMLFEEKCLEYESIISVDSKILAKLPSMKDVGTNLFY